MQYVDPYLPREIFGWRSPRLGMDMPIVRYGYHGHALLLYPTAQADFLENERFFLIKAIEPLIFAGRVQVFSIDSINRHAWMNRHVPVLEQARRQALYSGYVEEEVAPHIRRCLGDPYARIATSGASFGAFHAANQFFRRPDLFDTLIAMSGFYDLEGDYLEGHSNDEIFFNNPMWFVREMHDSDQLRRLQHDTDIHILTGEGAYEAPHEARRFSQVLWDKGIWHDLDVWGKDVNHDWPWWRRMLPYVIAERARRF
ncbi:MAG: prolyl oligopeptidase family serine peptidase [Myxococcales bacterium]|nr:prolyl oligopeptidase family serine peptidase [Myxococcales bacterium]